MCGRVACSNRSISIAKEIFVDATKTARITTPNDDDDDDDEEEEERKTEEKSENGCSDIIIMDDNWNLSPGMKSVIFHRRELKKPSKNINTNLRPRGGGGGLNSIACSEQTWGLVPKSGTKNNPIPPGPSKHFANLMFNARSDTLYDKRTFRELLFAYPNDDNEHDGDNNEHVRSSVCTTSSYTCIWSIDGYYEWKVPDGDVLDTDKKKQPYYVYRNDRKPLFIPGLWTSVYTGREEETLETFTMLTTDATSSLQWLHHRQPVMIFEDEIATEWMLNPSKKLLQQISAVHECEGTSISSSVNNSNTKKFLSWHPVTKKMSNVTYRNDDCTKPIKIEKVPSIKSFFGSNTNKTTNNRSSSSNRSNQIMKKKRNITDFAASSKANNKKSNFFSSSSSSTFSSTLKSPSPKKTKIEKGKDIIDLTEKSDDDDDNNNKDCLQSNSMLQFQHKSKRSKLPKKSQQKGILKFFKPKSR